MESTASTASAGSAAAAVTENPAIEFFGGLLIEIFIACILFGITTLQTFFYFQTYKHDGAFMRATVALVWVLEAAHTAFCISFCYEYLINQFGNFAYFLQIDWAMGVTVLTELAISCIVQLFYVRRVWIMSSKNYFLAAGISVFILCRIGFGIGSGVLSYTYPEWIPFRAIKSSLVTVSGGLGAAVVVDVLVAVTLSYYLMKGRTKWHKESNSRVNKIIAYAVNTGAITCLCSIVVVILFAIQEHSLIFLGLVEIQGKLYSNSFLGSLNARSYIRNQNSSSQYPSENYSQHGFRSTNGPTTLPKVEVFRHTVVTDDMNKQVTEVESDEYNMKKFKGGELV